MNPKIKILIAEDHPIFRDGLRQVIEQDPRLKVVAVAADGQAALDLLPQCDATIALLDIDMPRKDGFEVAQAIREKRLPIAVIFLTMHKDERFLNAALDLGVSGYLLKDSAATEVINCINAVAAGQGFVSPQLTGYLISRSSGTLTEQVSGLKTLTATERRILQMVAEYKTSREIADLLCLGVRTVEFHRANICEKLELKGSHALIKFAAEHRSEL